MRLQEHGRELQRDYMISVGVTPIVNSDTKLENNTDQKALKVEDQANFNESTVVNDKTLDQTCADILDMLSEWLSVN